MKEILVIFGTDGLIQKWKLKSWLALGSKENVFWVNYFTKNINNFDIQDIFKDSSL